MEVRMFLLAWYGEGSPLSRLSFESMALKTAGTCTEEVGGATRVSRGIGTPGTPGIGAAPPVTNGIGAPVTTGIGAAAPPVSTGIGAAAPPVTTGIGTPVTSGTGPATAATS